MPTFPPDPRHALHLFREVMPGVSGVLLASEQGAPIAHDAGMDAPHVAAQALTQRKVQNLNGTVPGASTFVMDGRSVYLVVFVPPDLAAAWHRPLAPA